MLKILLVLQDMQLRLYILQKLATNPGVSLVCLLLLLITGVNLIFLMLIIWDTIITPSYARLIFQNLSKESFNAFEGSLLSFGSLFLNFQPLSDIIVVVVRHIFCNTPFFGGIWKRNALLVKNRTLHMQ